MYVPPTLPPSHHPPSLPLTAHPPSRRPTTHWPPSLPLPPPLHPSTHPPSHVRRVSGRVVPAPPVLPPSHQTVGRVSGRVVPVPPSCPPPTRPSSVGRVVPAPPPRVLSSVMSTVRWMVQCPCSQGALGTVRWPRTCPLSAFLMRPQSGERGRCCRAASYYTAPNDWCHVCMYACACIGRHSCIIACVNVWYIR